MFARKLNAIEKYFTRDGIFRNKGWEGGGGSRTKWATISIDELSIGEGFVDMVGRDGGGISAIFGMQ